MNYWDTLENGLKGKNIKDVFRLYIQSVFLVSPVAIFIGLTWGSIFLFQVTPILVLLLVTSQYLLLYKHKNRSRKSNIQRYGISSLNKSAKFAFLTIPVVRALKGANQNTIQKNSLKVKLFLRWFLENAFEYGKLCIFLFLIFALHYFPQILLEDQSSLKLTTEIITGVFSLWVVVETLETITGNNIKEKIMQFFKQN